MGKNICGQCGLYKEVCKQAWTIEFSYKNIKFGMQTERET